MELAANCPQSPNSVLIQLPWVLRVAEDERSFFYYNLDTQEICPKPPPTASTGVAEPLVDSVEAYDSLCDHLSLPGKSATIHWNSAHQGSVQLPTHTLSTCHGTNFDSSNSRDTTLHLQWVMARGNAEMTENPEGGKSRASASTGMRDLMERYDQLALMQEHMAECLSQFVVALPRSDQSQNLESHLHSLSPNPAEWFARAQRNVTSSMRVLLYASARSRLLADDQTDPGLSPLTTISLPTSDEAYLPSESPVDQGRIQWDSASTKPGSPLSSLSPALYNRDSPPDVPPAIAAICERVTNSLARWLLSSQTLIELIRMRSSSSPQDKLESASMGSRLRTARFVTRIERVRDDTMDLLRTANELSAELDKLRATATSRVVLGQQLPSDDYPVSFDWPIRLCGVLLPGKGPRGIDPHTLSGGAAAGWRGNGFVKPHSDMKASPGTGSESPSHQVRGGSAQLLELSGPIAEAVSSGSRDVQNHLADLGKMASRLAGNGLISSATEANGSCIPAPDHSTASPADNARTSEITTSTMLDTVHSALARAGSFVTLIEDVDLASSFNVNSHEEDSDAISHKASTLMASFIQLKQDLYDGMTYVFADSQEAINTANLQSEGPLNSDAAARLAHASSSLASVVASTTETLQELASLANEEARDRVPQRGTRARLRSESQTPPALAPATHPAPERKVAPIVMPKSATHDGMMYLGPGVVVPDGPAAEPEPEIVPSDSITQSLNPSLHHASLHAAPWGKSKKKKIRTPNAALSALRGRSVSTTISSAPRRHSFLPTRVNTTRAPADDLSAPAVLPNLAQSTTSLLGPSRSPSLRPVDLSPSDPSPPHGYAGERTLSADSITTPLTSSAADTRVSLSTTVSSVSTPQAQLASVERKAVERGEQTSLPPEVPPQDVNVAPDGHIKGATLEALIVHLTRPDPQDALFDSTFLLTFRSFTSTDVLLDHLFQRFCICAPAGLSQVEAQAWTKKVQRPIQLHVFRILKMWLEMYMLEPIDAPQLPRLRAFVQDEMIPRPGMKVACRQLIRILDDHEAKSKSEVNDPPKTQLLSPSPSGADLVSLDRVRPRQENNLLSLNPLAVAQQLTLMEMEAFACIQPFECLNKAWSRPSGTERAKGIKKVIHLSNLLSGWTSSTVLQKTDVNKRALLVRHFIAIACQCRNLNNFSTMTAIVSGLYSSPVHRLRKTWAHVPSLAIQQLHGLNSIMQSTKNFASYRAAMHQVSPPCIPFLGVYLTDLTFIEDGNPDRLRHDERLINFAKQHMTSEVVREIMIYQSIPYVSFLHIGTGIEPN